MKKILLNLVIYSFILSCAATGKNDNLYTLSVVHFNDSHTSGFELTEDLTYGGKLIRVPVGGYARLIASLKSGANNTNRITLFAGDALSKGKMLYDVANVELDAKMLHMAGVDVMAVGNHEFDSGMAGFKNFIGLISGGNKPIEVLASNLRFDDKDIASKVKPYIIKVINGRKVGIAGIGVADPSSMSKMDNLTFINHIEEAKIAVKDLKKKGVDIIIFITHIGFANDIKLAQTVGGIDLIVGGHSHTVQGDFSAFGLDSAVKEYPYTVQNNGENTLIVTAASHTKNLGSINITFNTNGIAVGFNGNSAMLIGSSAANDGLEAKFATNTSFKVVDSDSEAEAVIKKYEEKIPQKLRTIKFAATEDLKSVRDSDAPLTAMTTSGHSGIGIHFAQALIDESMASSNSADVAIVNTGSIKQKIKAGAVALGAFRESIPYENDIVVFTMKGADLLRELKNATHRAVSGTTNHLPCIAGLKMKYTHNEDITKARVENIKIFQNGAWTAFDNNSSYKVTAPSFIYHGGDRYTFSEHAANLVNMTYKDREAFENYLDMKKTIGQPEDTLTVVIP